MKSSFLLFDSGVLFVGLSKRKGKLIETARAFKILLTV